MKIKIEGMTCAACQNIIEEETLKLNGVESATVNFATETGEFKTNDQFDADTFYALLNKLGYKAVDESQRYEEVSLFKSMEFYKVIFALTLSSVVMFFAMVIHNNWIQLVLTTILVVFFSKKFILSVFSFKSSMHTLIGLGVLSSYFYSIYLMVLNIHAHTYFEGGAFIISFTMLGQFMDHVAKKKAQKSISSLYKMQVKFASLMIDGKEVNTPVVNLKSGDIIRIKPGDKFPLDGVVTQGSTHVNESMLTGESHSLAKHVDSKVFAGSINLDGSILVRVESNLHSTMISQIVNFVEKAQTQKAPIQKYADNIIKYFVPLIVVIALLSFAAWYLITGELEISIIHMITVFVIACPCALGLAVPMAIMISTGEASKDGLLISGGDVVEKGSHIDTVVFDKTGTLTTGAPIVTTLYIFEKEKSKEEVILLSASLSQLSTHPLSKTICEHAKSFNLNLLDPDTFKNLTGLGVSGSIGSNELALGNMDLMESIGATHQVPPTFYEENIGSYVFVSLNQKVVAAYIINDPIKPEAKETISALKALGMNIWMLSGDHQLVANSVAKSLGIDNVKAQTKPVEKADFIKALKEKGHKVAMIGDGINDAPALILCDLSMAMSNGSDIALESSEVSILEGNIKLVSDFFVRSKKTMRVIKENLLLSSIYNIVCIPFAAGLFYPFFKVTLNPMWASLAMALSSFSVILNSFRAKR